MIGGAESERFHVYYYENIEDAQIRITKLFDSL